MPRTRRSAVTEKCQKVAGPESRKNAKMSQVRGHGKMPKGGTSAVTKICHKVAAQRSRKNDKKSQVRAHGKMPKTRRSVITEKYKKMLSSAVIEKCLKLASLL